MRRAPKRLLPHFVRPITHDHSPFSRATPIRRDFSFVSGKIVANGLLSKLDGFHDSPSRNLETLAENPVQAIPSRQRKAQERSRLEDAFESASTLEDMLGAFRKMESFFDEKELGLASLKVGLKLDQEDEDPEKVLGYAEKALKALDVEKGGDDLSVVMALQLMGSASYGLNRFNDSLGYLNRANVKTAMGRREEAIRDLRKCLEIKELTFEEDCAELGKANREGGENRGKEGRGSRGWTGEGRAGSR